MMKSIIIIMSFSILLLSCNEKITYYEYNGRVITYIDNDSEIYFYKGEYDENNAKKVKSYIRAKKNKVDRAIEAYLYWNSNGEVEVYPTFGDFSQIGEKHDLSISSYFIIDTTYESSPEMAKLYGEHYVYSWIDSLVRDDVAFDNVIYFSSEKNIIGVGNYKKVNSKTKVKEWMK